MVFITMAMVISLIMVNTRIAEEYPDTIVGTVLDTYESCGHPSRNETVCRRMYKVQYPDTLFSMKLESADLSIGDKVIIEKEQYFNIFMGMGGTEVFPRKDSMATLDHVSSYLIALVLFSFIFTLMFIRDWIRYNRSKKSDRLL